MTKMKFVLKTDYSKYHKDLYTGAIIEVIFNVNKYISLDYNVIIEYADVAHIESESGKEYRNEKDYIIYQLQNRIAELDNPSE